MKLKTFVIIGLALAALILSGCLSKGIFDTKGFEKFKFDTVGLFFDGDSKSMFQLKMQNKSNQDFNIDLKELKIASGNNSCIAAVTSARWGKIGAEKPKDCVSIGGNGCEGLAFEKFEHSIMNPGIIEIKAGDWLDISGNLNGYSCGKLENNYSFNIEFNYGGETVDTGTLTGTWAGPLH